MVYDVIQTRIEKLRSYMEKENLDGFYIVKPANVRYMSLYTGDDSFLFITSKDLYFITDPRYTEQVAIECPDFTIVNWREPGKTIGDSICDLVLKSASQAIGFEADVLTFDKYTDIQNKSKCALVPSTNVIESFRAVKTKEEIEKLRITCDIASRAFDLIVKDIRIGVTEKELASKLSHYMVMLGADTKPYGGILISGARTSLLHGIPSSKSIEYGDFVLMDYGCQYEGYLSDMTRTVVAGKATPKQREIYEIEKQMVADVEEILRPGCTGVDTYHASIKAIEGTEYFPYHYKGIGHGIGYFVHEIPFIGATSDAVLEEGNVITVEPGIYIPGYGGVRIEDQVLITSDGYENLISATKDLIEV